jgi:hypothetical protein
MKIGQKIDFIRDNLHPLKSPNTDIVSAWLTCGGSLLKEDPYSWTVEDTSDGPLQQLTYHIDGDIDVTVQGETIDFQEFRRRWMDQDWCRANDEHLISYLRLFRDNSVKFKAWIKGAKPAVLIRRGSRVAVIHPDLPEAKKAKILAEL